MDLSDENIEISGDKQISKNSTFSFANAISRYQDQDNLDLATDRNAKPDDAKIEGLIQDIFPENTTDRIVKVYNESDGPDETIAFVEPASNDGSEWNLGYDEVDVFDLDSKFLEKEILVATLVHEIAHVISLDNTQVRHTFDLSSCLEVEIVLDEGCAFEDSYITNFTNDFWTEEEVNLAKQNESDSDFQFEFYEDNPDRFVTSYAATNNAEDFAESFTFFVFANRPSGDSLADQKINFFYNYPELINFRVEVRDNIEKVY